MRKARRSARRVAVFLAALLALSAPLNAAAAALSAPVLVPAGLPGAAGAAAALAPTFTAAPVLSGPALAAPPSAHAAAPAALSPALAAAAAPAPAAAVPAAPFPARALVAAAARSAALVEAGRSADSGKAAAGRSFDLSADRPAASAAAIPGEDSRGPRALTPARAAAPKSLTALPAYKVPLAARARAYAPKALLAAAAGLAAWTLHHFGLSPVAAAPLALLAGTIDFADGAPSPSLVARFLAETTAAAAPGTILTDDAAARIGQRLALNSARLKLVMTKLIQTGDLALMNNRTVLHFSFAARVRANAGLAPELALDEAAAGAVRLLSSGDPTDHAKGLTAATRVVDGYAALAKETGSELPQAAEARVLKSNLALEHLGDVLRSHKAGLEASRPAGDALRVKRVTDTEAVLSWLETAAYSTGRVPSLPQDVHGKILGLMSGITPRDQDGGQPDHLVTAYVETVDQFEKFDPRDFVFEGAPAKPSEGGGSASDADGLGLFLVKRVMPGERIGDADVQAGMATLGWESARAKAALTELARRGYVVIRDNGIILMTSLSYRADGGDAHENALAGVKFLNSTDPLDHLRAVSRLENAGQRYAEMRRAGGDTDGIYAEIQVLKSNAILEVSGDALRALERALGESLSGERAMPDGATRENLGTRLAEARAALEWLKTAAYSADRRFEMPVPLAEILRDLIDLRAFREIVMGKINGDMDIVRGTRLTREFLARNAEGARAASAVVRDYSEPEAPVTPGGFRPLRKSEYKTLLNYGTDVTQKAVDGLLRPMIGRKAEMRQIVKTLLRVEKNNPLIIGEKGVGKTAIVNGLAQLIASGEMPELRGRNLIKIDLNKVVAGTSSRGMFEERMQGIIDEAKKSSGRVILFIDEIHMIVGAGDSDKSTDAAQILKESLADGSLSLIGATTMDEFRRIEKDGALMRRFNPVKLLPPTKDEAVEILEGVKGVYEKKHAVTIALETVKAAVSLALRYVTDRHLPDSALDLMDDASAEVELKAGEARARGVENPSLTVVPEDIAKEVEMRTGIPAGKLNEDSKTSLKGLPTEMKGQVIGQDEAVEAVAQAVQAGETGYRDPKQPIASFVFLGPTGVGKTELARALAKIKFKSEKNMLRLDMSEYQEKSSVSRLISAPPGYVGHDEGGQLTEPIRRNPYQVILFDEIEKAHPEVFDVLLQVLEDGRLTDGQGRTVDFSNTIIIMTSNIGGSVAGAEDAPEKHGRIGFRTGADEKTEDGSGEKMDGIGFRAKLVKTSKGANGAADARKAKYLDEFKKKYRPEFVNRVGEDRVIVFNEITEKSKLGLILDLRLKALESQLKDKRLTVVLTAAAREAVLTRALEQSRYGARPIKQIVDRQINQALMNAELEGRIADGDAVSVDWTADGGYRAGKIR
jgi:ATP-dependent Clp protease ATP-binding subunit ClpC